MANPNAAVAFPQGEVIETSPSIPIDPSQRKPPQGVKQVSGLSADPLLTVDDVARLLNVSRDWVWDHSSRRKPLLPVIRMGDGTLRYRPTGIEQFVNEQERMSALRRRAG